MTPEYVAGLFDGEGCVTIHQSNRIFKLRCTIAMTCLSILEKLKTKYGGSIHQCKGTNKPVYHWQIYTESAKQFLVDIAPHVQVKQAEVELALNFVEVCIGRRGYKLSPDELNLRSEYKSRLQRLKTL